MILFMIAIILIFVGGITALWSLFVQLTIESIPSCKGIDTVLEFINNKGLLIGGALLLIGFSIMGLIFIKFMWTMIM